MADLTAGSYAVGQLTVDGPTLRNMLSAYEVAQGECQQIQNSFGNAQTLLRSYWQSGASARYDQGMGLWLEAFGRVRQQLDSLDGVMNQFEQSTGITEQDATSLAGSWASNIGSVV
jgi:WXG100 family type VII secretion target